MADAFHVKSFVQRQVMQDATIGGVFADVICRQRAMAAVTRLQAVPPPQRPARNTRGLHQSCDGVMVSTPSHTASLSDADGVKQQGARSASIK
jgi:hypothetical protein